MRREEHQRGCNQCVFVCVCIYVSAAGFVCIKTQSAAFSLWSAVLSDWGFGETRERRKRAFLFLLLVLQSGLRAGDAFAVVWSSCSELWRFTHRQHHASYPSYIILLLCVSVCWSRADLDPTLAAVSFVQLPLS